MSDSSGNSDAAGSHSARAVGIRKVSVSSGAENTSATSGDVTNPFPVYEAPFFNPELNPHGKKASFTPQGTRTYLRENTALDRTAAKVNVPEPHKIKFRVKHTNEDGSEYFSDREFQRANEAKWDDQKWITDLNKWRVQTLDRLFRHDEEYRSRSIRTKWSLAEKNWLEYKIIKHGKKYGDQLNYKDWDRMSKAHEVRFVGTITKKGEELLTGKVAAVDQQIRRRNGASIHAQFAKMPEMKKMLQKAIDEFSEGELGDDSSDDDDELDHLSDDDEIHDGTSSAA